MPFVLKAASLVSNLWAGKRSSHFSITLDGVFAGVEMLHIARCAGSINNLLTGPPLVSVVSPVHLEVGHGAWAGQLGGRAVARVARRLEERQLLSNR